MCSDFTKLPITTCGWQSVFSLYVIFPIRVQPQASCDRSLRSLNPCTPLRIGLGIIAYAGLPLFLSDKTEAALGLYPTDQERRKLERDLAKLIPQLKGVDLDLAKDRIETYNFVNRMRHER